MKLLALDRSMSCTINGKSYTPDKNGFIDAPDAEVAVFESHGFTRDISASDISDLDDAADEHAPNLLRPPRKKVRG